MPMQEVITADGRKRYVVVGADGELIEPAVRYLKYLDSIGRARNTLRSYATSLSLFFEYLSRKGTAHSDVTLDDMAGFVLYLQNPYRSLALTPRPGAEAARAAGTVNVALTAVAGMYDYLWRRDDGQSDVNAQTLGLMPARFRRFKSFLHHIAQERDIDTNVLKQKIPKTRPRTITKAQIESLVNACASRRDKLLVRLLFESSLRIGEALALWIEDVDVGCRKLHIRDRGELANGAEIKTPSSCRSVDVSQELINKIMDYIAVCHTDEVETNHLFITLRGAAMGRPLAYHSVIDLFRRLKRKTSIDATPHVLRHSSLTELARAGWRPELLRERAGHAQFQTTYQMYVHPSDDDMREEWERAQNAVHIAESGKE